MRVFRKSEIRPFQASRGEVIHQYTGRLEKNGRSLKHSLAIMTLLPYSSSDPHVHQIAEESFLVIDGAGVIDVDGVRVDVVVGDCVFVEPGERHIVINPNAAPLRCVIATGPAWQPEDSYGIETLSEI
jgi:mannose-6-phosphate isomerase-like protein (cupin superfamily)